jgi:WD40 repeat protein
MSRIIACFVTVGVFLSARLAAAQPDDEKARPNAAPIVKNDAVPLPAGARLQLGKLAGFRYAGASATATLSADGKLLAVADTRDTITVVNTQTGKIVQALKGSRVAALNGGMTFSADNSTLGVQTVEDLTVWDVASAKRLEQVLGRRTTMRHQGPSLSANGKIVGVHLDRFAKDNPSAGLLAIDIAASKTIGPLASIHNGNIRTAIAPDGKMMLSWGQHTGDDRVANNTIQIWDLVKSKELHKVFIFSKVTAATFAPDGKSIAALTGAGNFHLINVETGKEIRRFKGERASIATMCYSPDGRRLVVYDVNGGIHAWDVAEGTRVTPVDTPKTQVIAVAFPDKDRIILLGMLGSTLYWWDATDTKVSRFEGHLTPVTTLAFTPDGRTIISGGAEDFRLIWWDAATGQELRQRALLPIDKRNALIYRPNALAISPDGKHAATCFGPGARGVQLWDLKTGGALHELRPKRMFGPAVFVFSPDGGKLALGGMNTPLSVWDVGSATELFALPPEKNGLNLDSRVAISPGGKMLAIYYSDRFERQQRGGNLILWDLIEKREQRRFGIAPADATAGNHTPGVTFSVDGKFLALDDGQGAIRLYSTATSREWHKLTSAARNSLLHFAISTDGRFLAVGSSPRLVGTPAPDALLEIWELASGQKRDQFRGHAAGITCLAFSPDSATVATGSIDTTVLLWDIAGKNAKLAPFAETEIPAAWTSLAGNPTNLSLTMRRLSKSPATLAFFKQHFQPAKQVILHDKKLAKLVGDLGADNFKTRNLAAHELTLLGERAQAALKNGLANNPPIEARRRIENLLDAMVRMEVTPEELQAIRGVEILERIATPEARDWLSAPSKGDPHARGTQEAMAALKRLEQK